MNNMNEIMQYLCMPSPDIQLEALKILSGITTSDDGINMIKNTPNLISELIKLSFNNNNNNIKKKKNDEISLLSLTCLINLCDNNELMNEMINNNIIEYLMNSLRLLKDNINHNELYTILLANLSSNTLAMSQLTQQNQPLEGLNIIRLTQLYVTKRPKTINDLDIYAYVANILCNVSQVQCVRKILCDPKRKMINFLAQDIQSKNSIRQMGILRTFRNCCIDLQCHDALIDENNCFIYRILISLLGPGQYNDKKLPDEVESYLPVLKFEENSEIRKYLLEMIGLLVRRKETRTYLRSINTYIILREIHKYEKSAKDEEEDREEMEAKLAEAANAVNVEEYFIRQDPKTGELIHESIDKTVPISNNKDEENDDDDDLPELIDLPS